MSQLLSSAVISTVGLTCKAFLNSGLCSITVSNLPVLLDALSRERRESGQGLVTVSNHLSTLDDPVTWGILPLRHFTNPYTIRWVLGASDIMFTNPFFSAFFRSGQVIETFRGDGIWQPALDDAIQKLNQGHWLHLFGEGKVCQPTTYPRVHGITHLPRFKWGVGRIIMETKVPPLIIPMWLTGFDKLMPEHRQFPFKYFPKIGVHLSITFGDPISPDKIVAAALNTLHERTSMPQGEQGASALSNAARSSGWIGDAIAEGGISVAAAAKQYMRTQEMRSEITAIIQRSIEDLGRKVSGDGLGLPLPDK